VSDKFELRISGVSEIETMELQNEIEKRTQTPIPVDLISEPLPNASAYGDPGLVHLLLTYGPQVISPLVAALAAWIAAGRKSHTSEGRTLVISKSGIVYSRIKMSDMEREGSGTSLEKALTSVFKGFGKDTDAEPSVK
jgi:hypothetical protein